MLRVQERDPDLDPGQVTARQRATWDRMLATDGLTEGFRLYLDPAG